MADALLKLHLDDTYLIGWHAHEGPMIRVYFEFEDLPKSTFSQQCRLHEWKYSIVVKDAMSSAAGSEYGDCELPLLLKEVISVGSG